MRKCQIIATRWNENTQRNESYVINIELIHTNLNKESEIRNAIKKACTDYVKNTPEGKEEYKKNEYEYNWKDFAFASPTMENVCKLYGFRILDVMPEITLNADMNEQLVRR